MNYYDNQTYYDILGVEKTASFESIEKAKYRLKFGNSDDRVPFSMWNKIDEAYNVLHDPDKRREYDKYLDEKDIYSNSGVSTTPTNDDNSSKTDENEADKEPNSVSDNEMTQDVLDTEQPTVEPDKTKELNNDSSDVDLMSYSDTSKKAVEQEPEPVDKNDETEEDHEYIQEKNVKPSNSENGFIEKLNNIKSVNRKKLSEKIGKLQKKSKLLSIKKVTTEETRMYDEYLESLYSEIDKLLTEPHNNYKLAVNRLKLEKQISLLNKILESRVNTKEKKDFSYKLDIISLKTQINDAKSKIDKIDNRIKTYDAKQRLTRLNENLIDTNRKISQRENRRLSTVRLEKKRSKLLEKRNDKALKVKVSLIRSQNIYDKFRFAKNFVKTLGHSFDDFDEVENLQGFAAKVR